MPDSVPPSTADIAFETCLSFTDELEGGTDKPRIGDPNYTVIGAIQSDLDEFNEIHKLPPSSIREITESTRRQIFRELYFDRAGCEFLDAPLNFILYQFAVNKYPEFAVKQLQKFLGAVEDGQITRGGETATKALAYGILRACMSLLTAQLEMYRHIVETSNHVFQQWQINPEGLARPTDQRENALGWLDRCLNAATFAAVPWAPDMDTVNYLKQQHSDFKAEISPA